MKKGHSGASAEDVIARMALMLVMKIDILMAHSIAFEDAERVCILTKHFCQGHTLQ